MSKIIITIKKAQNGMVGGLREAKHILLVLPFMMYSFSEDCSLFMAANSLTNSSAAYGFTSSVVKLFKKFKKCPPEKQSLLS